MILDANMAKRLLSYDSESGLFYWKERTEDLFEETETRTTKHQTKLWNKRHANKLAGFIDKKDGYVRIKIFGFRFLGHRIAWLYMTGEWPEEEIDHINGNRADNCFVNLRQATSLQNNRNQKLYKNNRSGKSGVTYHKLTNKWQASIGNGENKTYLGLFKTKEEAIEARNKAEIELNYDPTHGRN